MTREKLLKVAKPILFNTEMVKAILDGRKTVTRLTIDIDVYSFDFDTDGTLLSCRDCCGDVVTPPEKLCRFQPNDILYVCETWSQMNCFCCNYEDDECELNIDRNGYCPPNEGCCDDGVYVYKATDCVNSISYGTMKWHSSIHMPKEAARIFLKVTDVRAERLQDIWASDTSKSGLYFDRPHTVEEMIQKYADLWDSTINKSDLARHGWKANPYVWVIEFERIEPTK